MGKKPKRTWRRNFIRNWREYRGLTQEQLAERIDRSTATVSLLETQKAPYTQETLESLAQALQCQPSDLLTGPPGDPADIMPLWKQADPDDRRKLLEIAKTLIGTSR